MRVPFFGLVIAMERKKDAEIQAENLAFEYIRRDEDGNVADIVRALDGVSMEIKKGTFLAVLGHNGCGKSTFARHLNALLTPGEGTLWVGGMDTADSVNTLQVRKEVGMVFQNPDNQIIGTVVEEDVAFGLENIGVETAQIWNRVGASLRRLGMEKFRYSSPNKLSGGQKQKVAIAGILAMQPGCIVLDEATSMLDPAGRREVLEAVRELNQKEGITIILITHYMQEALYADQAVVMEKGKLVMAGTPREIFSEEETLRGLKLEVPPVTEIADRLRNLGLPFAKGILTVQELIGETEKLSLLPAKERERFVMEAERRLKKQKSSEGAFQEAYAGEKSAGSASVHGKRDLEDGNRKPFSEGSSWMKEEGTQNSQKAAGDSFSALFAPPVSEKEARLSNETTGKRKQGEQEDKEIFRKKQKFPILVMENVCYSYEKEKKQEKKKRFFAKKAEKRLEKNTAATAVQENLEDAGSLSAASAGNENTVADTRRYAVSHVSLSIYQGEFLALIGHTGSGKSTLLQMMNGLLKAEQGSIYYRGQDISDSSFSMPQLRHKIGLVFQYPEYQLFESTVVKDVMFGPKNQGLSLLEAQMNTFEALRLVGIGEDLFDVSPFDLSGGQKRRVAIAGVLAMKPELMILDEPAAGLDPKSRRELFAMLKTVHEKTGMAVLIVSHSMEDAAEYAQRILVLKEGELLFDDVPERVFSHEKELRTAGLDIPEAAHLMKQFGQAGLVGDGMVYTNQQAVEAIVSMIREG